MDLRKLIPLAPALMRPALSALADRLDKQDARLHALELRLARHEAGARLAAGSPSTPDL